MKIIECPRDAWQGFHPFIATSIKAEYINQLLKVGFDTIDFGSFVSPKAMPQVRDTSQLIGELDLEATSTKLLAIVANERGATEACQFPEISYLGFPFSISETFQIRNTQSTMEESLKRVQNIASICEKHGKEMVIYISMGFGNPYGDIWNIEMVSEWVQRLAKYHIRTFSLSDTVGLANPEDIATLFKQLIAAHSQIEFGAHFHVKPLEWQNNITAAYRAGCRRFDGAILGYGGCPMAQDDLVGNMATENLLLFAKQNGETLNINNERFTESRTLFQELISLI